MKKGGILSMPRVVRGAVVAVCPSEAEGGFFGVDIPSLANTSTISVDLPRISCGPSTQWVITCVCLLWDHVKHYVVVWFRWW